MTTPVRVSDLTTWATVGVDDEYSPDSTQVDDEAGSHSPPSSEPPGSDLANREIMDAGAPWENRGGLASDWSDEDSGLVDSGPVDSAEDSVADPGWDDSPELLRRHAARGLANPLSSGLRPSASPRQQDLGRDRVRARSPWAGSRVSPAAAADPHSWNFGTGVLVVGGLVAWQYLAHVNQWRVPPAVLLAGVADGCEILATLLGRLLVWLGVCLTTPEARATFSEFGTSLVRLARATVIPLCYDILASLRPLFDAFHHSLLFASACDVLVPLWRILFAWLPALLVSCTNVLTYPQGILLVVGSLCALVIGVRVGRCGHTPRPDIRPPVHAVAPVVERSEWRRAQSPCRGRAS